MLRFVILLVAFSYALGAVLPGDELPQLDGRIVGGEPTTIDQFPWQVSIQRYGSHFCGGVVYSSRIIITAAHCLPEQLKVSTLSVRIGSTYYNSGGTLAAVAAFKTHKDYNSWTMVNDIGLIYLKSSLTMSSTIKSIPLAISTPLDGANAVVSGWGRTSSDGTSPIELRYVELDIVSRQKCSSPEYNYSSQIKENMVCAYTVDKDSCQGDSGGPMVSDGVLVGIVSWGIGCAKARYPGVYTDVAAYRTWVEETASSF